MIASTWNFIALDDLRRLCKTRGLTCVVEGEYCIITESGKPLARTLVTQDRRVARHSVRHVFAYPVLNHRTPLAWP